MNPIDYKIIPHFLFKVWGLITFVVSAYFKTPAPTKHLYQFIESYKNDSDKQIIVAKINNSIGKIFKISAVDLVTKKRDLLAGFNTDDMINIIALATIEKNPVVSTTQIISYKYYALFAMLFISTLIASNIMAEKLVDLFGFPITGGFLAYGCTYILSDIITEVYGYKRTRQLIWGTVVCNLLFIGFIYLAIQWQPSSYWHNQQAYALALGAVPKIIFVSLASYTTGEFINSYVIARMKLAFNGQNMWIRIASSSFLGITVDTTIFATVAYAGTIPLNHILPFILHYYLYKLSFEFAMIPGIVYITKKIKASEAIDIFDIDTQFTPFSLDISYSDANNRMQQPQCTPKAN